MNVDLSTFDNRRFDRGAPRWQELLWLLAGSPLMESILPGSNWRRGLLRLFGSEIATGVVFKPRVRIKFPWRLKVGAHSWIGEAVWLDNLDWVRIGSHACLSQGAFLGTGNHDWSSPGFRLFTAPIEIGDQAWVGARSCLGPGSIVGEGAILAQGAVFSGAAVAWQVYAGQPARAVKTRTLRAAR